MNTAIYLKQIRRTLCLNQSEFSKALRVARSSISRYESGLRQPSFPIVRRIMALAKKHKIIINLDDIRPD